MDGIGGLVVGRRFDRFFGLTAEWGQSTNSVTEAYSSYLGEVPESKNLDRIWELLFSGHGWRKPGGAAGLPEGQGRAAVRLTRALLRRVRG